MKTKVQELSAAFSRIVRQTLTPEQIFEVVDINRKGLGINVCATHNYLDANELMMEAWRETFQDEPFLFKDTEYHIWNAAWHLSQLTEFNEVVIITPQTKAIVWSHEDVLKQAKDMEYSITDEQAQIILDKTIQAHNATTGITWENFAFNIQSFGTRILHQLRE